MVIKCCQQSKALWKVSKSLKENNIKISKYFNLEIVNQTIYMFSRQQNRSSIKRSCRMLEKRCYELNGKHSSYALKLFILTALFLFFLKGGKNSEQKRILRYEIVEQPKSCIIIQSF